MVLYGQRTAAHREPQKSGRIKTVFIKQRGIYGHFSWYHNTHKTCGMRVSTYDFEYESYFRCDDCLKRLPAATRASAEVDTIAWLTLHRACFTC